MSGIFVALGRGREIYFHYLLEVLQKSVYDVERYEKICLHRHKVYGYRQQKGTL